MNNKGGNPVSTGALSSRWSGNPGRRHGHKSKQRHGRTDGRQPSLGEGAQAGNFQVSTLSSFHSRKEGRKEGRRPETSGSGGWDGGRIRFGADKIHIKGAAEHCGSTCTHLVRRLIASIQIRNNKCSAGPD